jgi:ATP synthase protein I
MSDRDGMPDPSTSAEDTELSDRLRKLGKRLDAHRDVRDEEVRRDTAPRKPGVAMAMRLGADFVAGVVVGAALGWGFDRLFDTSPWGLVVLLLLGFAAGLLNVMRSAGLVRPGIGGADRGRDGKQDGT